MASPGSQHALSHGGHAVGDLLQRLTLADAQPHSTIAAQVAYGSRSAVCSVISRHFRGDQRLQLVLMLLRLLAAREVVPGHLCR
jgi:hypothetical protein